MLIGLAGPTFAASLSKSNLKSLNIAQRAYRMEFGTGTVQALADSLPQSQLIELNLSGCHNLWDKPNQTGPSYQHRLQLANAIGRISGLQTLRMSQTMRDCGSASDSWHGAHESTQYADDFLTTMLNGLWKNPGLKTLELSRNKFGPRGGHALVSGLPDSQLKRLTLGGHFSPCSKSVGKELAVAMAQSKLEVLDLDQCAGLGTGTGEAFAGALNSGKLTSLTLFGRSGMTKAAGVSIANALPCSQLRSLSLIGCTALEADTAFALAAVLPTTKLHTLVLDGCKHIGNEGVGQIAQALPSCQLTTLVLISLNIDDQTGEKIMASLPDSNLRLLKLCDCRELSTLTASAWVKFAVSGQELDTQYSPRLGTAIDAAYAAESTP